MTIFWGSQRWLQAAAAYVRYQVFVLEQGIAPQAEFDSLYQEDRVYGVCFAGRQPIAAIRYQTSAPHVLQPDRFCVLPAFRAQGVGSQLLAALESRALVAGCQQAQLSAATSALEFYKKNGYQQISQPYLEDGIPCVKMLKQLEQSYD